MYAARQILSVCACIYVCELSYLLQLTVNMLYNQIDCHHVAATWQDKKRKHKNGAEQNSKVQQQ